MTNDFLQKDRELFEDNYTCWWCGVSHANCGHHCMGRGSKNDDAESSILNYIPLNNFDCHINNGKLSWKQVKIQLLKKTWEYLKYKKQYQLKEKDKKFILKNKKYYVNICSNEVTKILEELKKPEKFKN